MPTRTYFATRLFCVTAMLVIMLPGTYGWPMGRVRAEPRQPLAAGSPRYDIGSPVLTDLWVDSAGGDDAHSGASRAQALRTITAAWQHIPAGAALTGTGYRILLTAGDYPEATFPLYWEDRHGTAQFPILIQAADGARTAHLQAFVNVYNVDYLYFDGLDITNHGDVFHCEQCRYVLIRNSRLDGGDRAAHETLKANQSQHLYIEDSDISGAYENAIDFVAAQYAHIVGNRIFHAGDWCAYVKGGSAYITVESNEFFDCDTGGFTAGQGAGFEYMVAPWLHYEAYAIRVVNNVVHDTVGAGLGVNGGYAVLLAYNTLYRVGQRSHVIEVVHGSRSCDGDAARCAALNALGGWGPAGLANAQPIPDRNIYIFNNVILNPAGYQSQWQQFAIAGPQSPDADSHVPDPARTDDNLRIQGNIIWNGPADLPLGIEGGVVCTDSNPTCTEAQLRGDNAINTLQPHLVDPAGGDYRLANAAALPLPVLLPAFPAWDTFTPAAPAAALSNAVLTDYAGASRSGQDQPGAFAAGSPAPPATTATATPTPTATPTATSTATPTATATADTPAATLPAADDPHRAFLPAVQSAGTQPAEPTPQPSATPTPTNTPTSTPTTQPTAAPTPLPGGPLTMVALGDSLTEGNGDDSAAGGGYPRRVLEKVTVERPGSTMLNLGHSGWTTDELMDPSNGALNQGITALQNAGGAKAAFLWIGSNDLWYLYEYDPDPMTAEIEAADLSNYTANVTAMVQRLRATGAAVYIGLMDDQSLRPVVANPPNPAEPAFPGITADDRQRMSAQVTRYNTALRAIAAADGASVVDFYDTNIFTDPTTLADDGNHPNAAGYDIIANLWFAKLP